MAKGGITKGKSHKEGGIPMVVKSTGQKVELEGGEGVINKRNMSDTKKHKFDGKELTKCEVVSEINEDYGNGVKIDCDDIVGRKYKYKKGGNVKRFIVHKEDDYDGEVMGSSDTFRGAKMIQNRLENKGVFDDVDKWGIADTENYFYRRKDNKYKKGGRISYDNFIKEYILPNEDYAIREQYYEGTLDFDDDYIKEVADYNKLTIKDFAKGGKTPEYHWFVLDIENDRLVNGFEKEYKDDAQEFIEGESGGDFPDKEDKEYRKNFKIISKRTKEQMGYEYPPTKNVGGYLAIASQLKGLAPKSMDVADELLARKLAQQQQFKEGGDISRLPKLYIDRVPLSYVDNKGRELNEESIRQSVEMGDYPKFWFTTFPMWQKRWYPLYDAKDSIDAYDLVREKYAEHKPLGIADTQQMLYGNAMRDTMAKGGFVKDNEWGIDKDEFDELKEERQLDLGKWYLYYNDTMNEWEATMDGNYTHTFKSLNDLMKRKNEIDLFEYNEKLSEEKGEEVITNSKGEIRKYAKGGSTDRWIKTSGDIGEGSFVDKADKKGMSVKKYAKKVIKDLPQKSDFDVLEDWNKYKTTKKGMKEQELRKSAQFVANIQGFKRGGNLSTSQITGSKNIEIVKLLNRTPYDDLTTNDKAEIYQFNYGMGNTNSDNLVQKIWALLLKNRKIEFGNVFINTQGCGRYWEFSPTASDLGLNEEKNPYVLNSLNDFDGGVNQTIIDYRMLDYEDREDKMMIRARGLSQKEKYPMAIYDFGDVDVFDILRTIKNYNIPDLLMNIYTDGLLAISFHIDKTQLIDTKEFFKRVNRYYKTNSIIKESIRVKDSYINKDGEVMDTFIMIIQKT